ncbi:hypothetical protein ACIO52_02680 [Nocardia sp. NPDC087230]|uniref:hypothetical protein n=1 Tax=Nocardia sp. NPDC087230 TaxID=3364331 RepID=UPI003824EF03
MDDDTVPYTDAQHQQLADWQSSPEFGDWLADEPAELARLVAQTPGLADLEDPWSAEGLSFIEAAALVAFPDITGSASAEQRALLDRMSRGIGHVFLEAFGEGKWVWVQTLFENPPGPALEIPHQPAWIEPETLLLLALSQRDGTTLARCLDQTLADHRHSGQGFDHT